MTVQVNYTNKDKSSDLDVIVLFADEKFQIKNINNFFSKKIKLLKFPHKISGSDLQIKIWKELKKITYGKTKSYGEIAKIVKTSPRYVGKVCGQNKFLLFIPCHRVIRSDGGLGGFSGIGGLALKKQLLQFEQ